MNAVDGACTAVLAHGADLLVISFGADTFEEDPISYFELREPDYAIIGSRIADLGIPAVVIIEGGYAIDALGRIASSFLSGFGQA